MKHSCISFWSRMFYDKGKISCPVDNQFKSFVYQLNTM